MSSQPIEVVVVTYNSRDYVRGCLDSIKENGATAVVVDNGSSDDTLSILRREYPNTTVITNPANGYAKALNVGLARTKGEFVILSNVDVVFLPGSIARLISYMQAHPDVAVVGPQQVTAQRSWGKSYGDLPGVFEAFKDLLGITTFHNELRRRLWPRKLDRRPFDVPYLDGAVLAVRRSSCRTVHGLDESFSFYAEETDFCARLRKIGWRVVFLPEAEVVHFRGGSSTKSEPSVDESVDKYGRLLVRAKTEFVARTSARRTKLYISLQRLHHAKMALVYRVLRSVTRGSKKSLFALRAREFEGYSRLWKQELVDASANGRLPGVVDGRQGSQKLKILMLDPSASAPTVHNLCNHLADAGCEVHLFTGPHWLRTAGQCASMKYQPHVYFYRRTQIRSYAAASHLSRLAWRLRRLADHLWRMGSIWAMATDFDVVHVQFFPVPAFDRVFLWLIGRRVPVLCTVHETVPHNSKRRAITGWLFRSIYRSADLLFTHTEHTDEQLISRYKISPSKLVRTPLGNLEHLLERRRENCNGAPRRVVLFAGEIREDKGLDVLVRSAPYLRRSANDFKIVVAGKACFDLSGIRRLADELGVADLFAFHLGFQEEQEFVDWLACSAVVVLPYRRVEQSAVAVAACTFGKPIVATRCGGLEELVSQAGNGLLVPVDNPVALADALGQLLVDDEKREAYGRRSAEYSSHALSWGPIAAQTVAGYRIALGRRGELRKGSSCAPQL